MTIKAHSCLAPRPKYCQFPFSLPGPKVSPVVPVFHTRNMTASLPTRENTCGRRAEWSGCYMWPLVGNHCQVGEPFLRTSIVETFLEIINEAPPLVHSAETSCLGFLNKQGQQCSDQRQDAWTATVSQGKNKKRPMCFTFTLNILIFISENLKTYISNHA